MYRAALHEFLTLAFVRYDCRATAWGLWSSTYGDMTPCEIASRPGDLAAAPSSVQGCPAEAGSRWRCRSKIETRVQTCCLFPLKVWSLVSSYGLDQDARISMIAVEEPKGQNKIMQQIRK